MLTFPTPVFPNLDPYLCQLVVYLLEGKRFHGEELEARRTTTLKNVTGISALQNATISCIPHLLTTHHKTHTIASSSKSILNTLLPGVILTSTKTKPPNVTEPCTDGNCPITLKGKPKGYIIGYKGGILESATGRRDPNGSCQPDIRRDVVNQTSCAQGYQDAYNAICGPSKSRFPCNS